VIDRKTGEQVSPDVVQARLETGGSTVNFMLLPGGTLRLRVHVGAGYVFFPLDDAYEAVELIADGKL
jgi:hypothetical protein